MKLQQLMSLRDLYKQPEPSQAEKNFSADLAENLHTLEVGNFEDAETESNVGTRRADIVAVGKDGTLVVENQFGKADWNHWGRLDAYARLKKADVAVLVAEDFEELMIAACYLRNEESEIRWYLIQVQANSHKELSFHHVVQPIIDIQTEKKAEGGYSEFWAPIRNGEFGELFAGRPVPISNDGWIGETINQRCYIQLDFRGENHSERRNKIMTLFPESEYDYEYKDTTLIVSAMFPVIDKGRKDQDAWPEMREKLVAMGTD
ncbi:hypothetical protein F4167_14855, partial [Candidatus Poribacteria bacterium]|nr:hypothetical protein [Candidatus Poribacteria bacterium]